MSIIPTKFWRETKLRNQLLEGANTPASNALLPCFRRLAQEHLRFEVAEGLLSLGAKNSWRLSPKGSTRCWSPQPFVRGINRSGHKVAPVGSPLLLPQGGGGTTQREGGGQKMVTSQAGADRSDLPLPRAQEEPGEVSGTGAAEQPRGTTTRLRGIRRQRLPGREHGGAARGDLGGTTAHRRDRKSVV